LMMVDGMVGALRTLFWSMVLLVGPLYAVAIFLRETLGQSNEDTAVTKMFATFPTAFLTIFRCVMGDCTSDQGAPLFVQLHWLYGVFYVLVIMLTSIGLFNVIIAIFVENTLVAAKSNETLQRSRRLADNKRTAFLVAGLVGMFVKAATLADGSPHASQATPASISAEDAEQIEIGRDLFQRLAAMPSIQLQFDKLDIAQDDRIDLFDILDADGSGSLTLGEIVNGVMKLRGVPKRSDIIANGLIIRSLQESFNRFEEAATRERALMTEHVKRNGELVRSLKEDCKVLAAHTPNAGATIPNQTCIPGRQTL